MGVLPLNAVFRVEKTVKYGYTTWEPLSLQAVWSRRGGTQQSRACARVPLSNGSGGTQCPGGGAGRPPPLPGKPRWPRAGEFDPSRRKPRASLGSRPRSGGDSAADGRDRTPFPVTQLPRAEGSGAVPARCLFPTAPAAPGWEPQALCVFLTFSVVVCGVSPFCYTRVLVSRLSRGVGGRRE